MNSVLKAKNLIPLKRRDLIQENFVFKLHSRWTSRILFIASVICTGSETFDEQLTCLTNSRLVDMANTYCLMANLFTENGNKQVYLAYYQWVPFFLAILAMALTLPHRLWSNLRGRQLETLVYKLSRNRKDLRFIKTRSLIWMIKLIFCEFLNTLNIVGQIYLTDLFLSGEYLRYGYDWLNHGDKVLEISFPKKAKCTFYTTGAGGGRQTHDSLCLLLRNVLYDKIFLILWYLHLVLLCLSVLINLWRILSLLLPRRLFFRICLTTSMGYTPNGNQVLERLSSFAELTKTDCLFISYALSNLDSVQAMKAISAMCDDRPRQRPQGCSSFVITNTSTSMATIDFARRELSRTTSASTISN